MTAPAHWLPPEDWVYNHWLPYDEGRLYELLGVTRGAIWRQLRDDRHNLAQLAARHGWPDPAKLAAALVAPREGEVSAATFATLRSRALRTITQGHLSQHLLFHSLHQFSIPSEAPAIFGVTDAEFRALRRGEQSPLEIGRLHGRSPSRVQALSAAVLRERVGFGVATGAMSARQGRLLLRRQICQLPRWLAQVRYNGPPPTHLGKLTRKPRNFAANPALSGDGGAGRLRGLRAEAAGRAQARRDQRARARGRRRRGAAQRLGAPGPPHAALGVQPDGVRRRAPRRVRVRRGQPQLRQALRPDPRLRLRPEDRPDEGDADAAGARRASRCRATTRRSRPTGATSPTRRSAAAARARSTSPSCGPAARRSPAAARARRRAPTHALRHERGIAGAARSRAARQAVCNGRCALRRPAAAGLRHRQSTGPEWAGARHRHQDARPPDRRKPRDHRPPVARGERRLRGQVLSPNGRVDLAQAGAARPADVDRRLVGGRDPAHGALRHGLAGRRRGPADVGKVVAAIKKAAVEAGRSIDEDHYGAAFPFYFGSAATASSPAPWPPTRSEPAATRARYFAIGDEKAILDRVAEYVGGRRPEVHPAPGRATATRDRPDAAADREGAAAGRGAVAEEGKGSLDHPEQQA